MRRTCKSGWPKGCSYHGYVEATVKVLLAQHTPEEIEHDLSLLDGWPAHWRRDFEAEIKRQREAASAEAKS